MKEKPDDTTQSAIGGSVQRLVRCSKKILGETRRAVRNRLWRWRVRNNLGHVVRPVLPASALSDLDDNTQAYLIGDLTGSRQTRAVRCAQLLEIWRTRFRLRKQWVLEFFSSYRFSAAAPNDPSSPTAGKKPLS